MFDTVFVHLVAATDQNQGLSVAEMFINMSGVVKATVLVLVGMSLFSWYVIGYKLWYLRRAKRASEAFLDHFWQSKRLDSIYQSLSEHEEAPVGQVFKAGYLELTKLEDRDADEAESVRTRLKGIENVERALRRAMRAEMTHLEEKVPYLATIGSTSPFVGLFGTVWGIMVAFTQISPDAQMQAVAQPISEALIVTALGLFAAVPAVIGYNYFTNELKVIGTEMDNFSNDFLNIVKRHFFE